MISRKQEERNEKIIRGLLKLPPNRKCINCNSMGPQYVCTNFWTFVCMTCSGIHREFTHRVKSISMSKFTTEEVEALQNGGNQRAREFFLKDWDPQMERLPNNSNSEKVRQFIKDVYADQKYAGENSFGKPPNDKQKLRNLEVETRRASSYHSYSQSPPYDYQYEERRYGKQAAPSLSRKPGSDRGIYEKSRVSDYSVSSGGDPFRSGPQSTSFQREVGYCSPSNADISSLDMQQHDKLNTFADTKAPPLQRTGSLGSDQSCNIIASNSTNSGSNVNAVTPSVSVPFDGLDLFCAPFVSQTITSTDAAAIDLFQLPNALSTSSVPNSNITSQSSLPPFLSLFPDPLQQENEGWATFDRPQSSELSQAFDDSTPETIPSTVGEKTDQFIFSKTSLEQPSFSQFHGSSSSSMLNQWEANHQNVGAQFNVTSPQHSWNVFEDKSGQQEFQGLHQQSSSQLAGQNPSSVTDQYLGFEVLEAGVHAHAPDQKSTNPFDLPYDSDMESGNLFLELCSLQAPLPNGQMPNSLVGGVTHRWFREDPLASFGPHVALGFTGPQVPSPQIQNIPTQAHVPSIGGNPFA